MPKRRSKYNQLGALPGSKWSDWEAPRLKGYRMACCSCGLVHEMDFRISSKPIHGKNGRPLQRSKGSVLYRVARDNRATGNMRRYHEPTLERTFVHFAAKSLVEVYAIAPDQLEGFIKRFRSAVRRRAKCL